MARAVVVMIEHTFEQDTLNGFEHSSVFYECFDERAFVRSHTYRNRIDMPLNFVSCGDCAYFGDWNVIDSNMCVMK
jgi:hypothetical protein